MWTELGLSDYLALLAFITAISCYRFLRPFPSRGFIPLLLLIIVVEWGAAAGHYMINKSNSWVYNILTTVEYCFYFYLFSRLLKNKKVKMMALFSALVFPVVVILNCAFLQGFNNLHTNTLIIGSLLTIIFTLIYFYELLQSPNEMKLFTLPFFWIGTGLLFYYTGDFVITVIFPHVVHVKDKTLNKIFRAIESNLNTLLYCCFIIAFLCQRKATNSFT